MRSLEEIREAVVSALKARADEIIEVGDYIWKHPEPGYREFGTSKYLVEKLESLGLKVKTGLAMTGFRADIDTGKPGPTVAFLGELDSLIIPSHPDCDPKTGYVHACGHCSSAASLYGTAIGILELVKLGAISGKVALIATPAEEGIEMEYRLKLIQEGKIQSIAGKPQLIREGVFDDVDIAYMSHLATNEFGYHDHNGSVNKRITFKGKGCHAASPQNGVNALNAVSLALHAIGLMREKYSNDKLIRIHGVVTNGGDVLNVIPDTTKMEYMLRAPNIPAIRALNDRFDHVVMHAGQAAECEVEIETISGYMPLLDDNELGDELKKVVDYLVPNAPFRAQEYFSSACTDMGDVATVVPAVHGYVMGAEGQGHTVDYRIKDKFSSYVLSSQMNAVFAANLLYGDAALGKHFAAKKADLMPIPEYVKLLDSLNILRKSEK